MMKNITLRKLSAQLAILTTLAALWSAPVLAYIGPGAGITVLGALWGVIVAIVLAIGAVVLWPFRTLLRRRRKRSAKTTSEAATESGVDSTRVAAQNDASPREKTSH